MELTYDGALVLPKDYVVMDEEEMTYVEGGGKLTLGVKIGNNSMIVSILAAVGGTLTVAKATAALTAASAAIITAIELGTAGMATLYAGALILAFGAIIPSIAGAAVTYGVNQLKGRTFKTTVDAGFLPDITLIPTI